MNQWLSLLLDFVAAAYWLPPLVAALILGALARIGVYPTRRMLLAFLIPMVLGFSLVWLPAGRWIIWTIDIVVVGIAALDFLSIRRRPSIQGQREIPLVTSIRKRHAATLHFAWSGKTPLSIQVRDDVPIEFDCQPDTTTLELAPRSRTSLRYEFRPMRRGAYQFRYVYGSMSSTLTLWRRLFKISVESTVHVYPDMKQLSQYAVLARTNRLSLIGVRRTRRTGQDNEFEQLRDYTPDDNYRFMDWRATAKRRKLTVRDYQINQSQRLMLLVDCGRMMTNNFAGLSLLDYSLNSMLMLGHVALAQGDSVGMLCFSDQIHAYVPPRAGLGQMSRLLHASFDRFPHLVESRYDQAFLHLSKHCRKRTLVLLVTNVLDEVNARQVRDYLCSAASRHLSVGVFLRDERIYEPIKSPMNDRSAMFQRAASAQILSWRHRVLTDLSQEGVRAIDVFPDEMTAPLINEYLSIKARHLL